MLFAFSCRGGKYFGSECRHVKTLPAETLLRVVTRAHPLPVGWSFKSSGTFYISGKDDTGWCLQKWPVERTVCRVGLRKHTCCHFDSADQPGQARVRQADTGGAAHQTCTETA